MANKPGPQRALGTRGQTINATSWPYFDGLIRAVVERTGVNYDALIVEGTRTYARQSYLYDGYRFGRIDPATGRKFNPAYPPNSPYAYHVAGDAVDFGAGAGIRGTAVQRALHELGPSFGIFFEVSNELWHGRCDLSRIPGTLPAGSNATPINPKPTEEDDMFTDEDRAWLKDVRAALTQEAGGGGKENPGIRGTVNVLAQRSTAPDPQAVHKLVRIKDRPDVFHSVDFHTLRGIPSGKVLSVLGWQLQQIGALDTRPIAAQVITVETLDDLKGFGTLIGPRPADPIYATL